MSSFSYGKHTKKHIGIWLKPHVNKDILKLIKKNRNRQIFDTISRVVVDEYDSKTDEVWLSIWCVNVIDLILRKHRYNVFYIKTKVNPDWSCHGDLGSGINF